MQRYSKILFLFLLLLNFSLVFSQNYYDQQWKKVQENSVKGTYKSNLPIILDIQNQAMKENNALQLIRSLKAEFSIVNQTTDDEKNDSASQFFVKLQSVEKNLKGDDLLLYKVLLSGFMFDYYNEHSWQINGRTNMNSQDVSQIETWSKLDFKNYLSKNYKALDEQSQVMKKVSFAKYKDAFSNTDDITYFPSLLDWYSLRKVSFLSDNGLFTKNELTENRIVINTIFDELIAHNSGNSKLYFMHQKLSENCQFSQCKDRLEQLQNLVKTNIDGDYKVLVMEEIINELVTKDKIKEALEIAAQAKSKFPKSAFLNNIKNRENAILNPYLSIKYEEQMQPEKPIHLVAEFKNVKEFSVNIYEVKDNFGAFMQYARNPYNEAYSKVKKTLVRKEIFQLNDPQDYQTHKTSLEIKSLPSGIYVAEYSVSGSKPEEESDHHFYFLVSNYKIIYQSKNDRNQLSNELKLVNSENGKSINNESLTFHEFVENKTLNKIQGKTDEKGVFKFPATESKGYYRAFLIQQAKTNDFQLMQVYGNNNREVYNPNKQTRTKAQIFTDRAIYRPGQTVYFKVINTKIDKEIEGVASGLKQKITLLDANNQEVSVQNFTTNEFGSYHGSFILPKGKLNGNFTLSTDGGTDGYKNFNVEEYKRPKFEVTFEPVKDEYKYGQTIELKGKAMMFSGVALSNTNVNYEIKKQNIRWRYFPWYPNDNDNENSILGDVKTNEKGEFTIKLDLKKDEKLEGIQIDNYQISASATDINGETQMASTNLKVASVSHYIKADDIKNTFADESVKLKVETKNYNEQNLKKSYKVKLSKLEAPDRILRDNFRTEVQNLPKFSKEEFISKFPHDLYDKNDELKNWKSTTVFEKTQQPATDNQQPSTSLDLGKLDAGDYQLELYNIEGKDTIKSTQNFSVWDKKSLKPNQKTFLTVLEPKDEFSRGEKAKIYVYSAIPDALVNVFIQDGSGKTIAEVQKFKNGILEYSVDVPKEKNVTNLNIQFQVVAFNDIQTETVNLKIKDTEQPLKIETVTFRDKLESNSKEKWSVKISGNDKEKINAEVLANMYDMSLDQFAVNTFGWQNLYRPYSITNSYVIRENLEEKYFQSRMEYFNGKYVDVPQFNWFDNYSFLNSLQGEAAGISVQEGVKSAAYSPPPPPPIAGAKRSAVTAKREILADEMVEIIQNVVPEPVIAPKLETPPPSDKDLEKIIVRQNLNETAFFYPDLKTDSEGNVNFEFTSPEALTKWKLMFLAHTKDARAATLEKEVVTQKEFSVTPNYPRFLREGDELNLQSKLSNLTSKKLSGSAQLQILDAFTNEDISSKFGLNSSIQNFDLNENGNSALTWKVKVPNNVSSIILKVVAKAGQYSDGEQKAVAVLPNRMLVTDALPIFVKEGETKTFVLENLKNTNSTTISNVSNTLELTTNPIWEILFALPSLKNDQNNSADVIFNKWFADVLASEIFKANPKIKTIFEQYQDAGILNSNLEKNQELKQLLLDETPWVLESKNETEQIEKLALLFDANTMKNSINQDWDDFKKLQNPDGGFSWYQGYPSSYGTSLYILKNLGKINVWLKDNMKDYQSTEQKELVAKLVQYVDNEINKYYDTSAKLSAGKENVINNWTLDYLDTRNYWEKQYPLKEKGATLKSLVKQKAKTTKITDFTFFGLHRVALLMSDYGLKDVSDKLLNYLKETSVDSKTQGVYWKQNLDDWGWFSSKVVNHAGALEAFNKLKPNDQKFIEEMKIWLITQKEVNSWGSSRGTSEVIFTILNSGKSWTSTESEAFDFKWGGERIPRVSVVIHHQDYGNKTLSHINGYQKITKNSEEIDKNLATVTVTKPGPGIVQGGLFWQYYEDLDKIKSSENYISITKELYKKIKTINGEELQKISAETPLKVGDKVTVRMILNTDRAMEFIHIKDMRAAGFEPLNVISGYQWKNNLGYYQSTNDASTNFYIQSMPKGKYVFEYDYVANASGKFSNGITTIQNYYAPQMNAHTKGTNVEIVE